MPKPYSLFRVPVQPACLAAPASHLYAEVFMGLSTIISLHWHPLFAEPDEDLEFPL